ncbi:MAG: WbqC family protein [Pontimonas sp.]
MIVGINQPYWIPYVGYFSLIGVVDTFVPLDTVQFSRKSWVARNYLVSGGQPFLSTIPLEKASQNMTIRDLSIDFSQPWRQKMLNSLVRNYKQTAISKPVVEMVERWFENPPTNLSQFLVGTIRDISRGLGMETRILSSDSEVLNPEVGLRGQDKIMAICQCLGANTYLNLPSGASLYDPEQFEQNRIKLGFTPTVPPELEMPGTRYKSILSHLMEVGFEGTRVEVERHFRVSGGEKVQ